jgi:serine/threonine protein kinase
MRYNHTYVDRIGRYRVLGEIGRGAMGLVYRAQDPAIGRVVAIKTIRLSDLTEESERERLKERLFREAQSAGILSHPNIVTIYDIAQENGTAYIFMEFVDGPSLERVLASDNPPNKAELFQILRQTAVGLDYAHGKGIVHRDIKPANILLNEHNQPKITDFGVARILSQQITHSGSILGTPNYMSPEQIQGHAVDGRADQFALAVIAYEILTGEKPFVADYLPTLLYKIVREEAGPPRRLNSSLAPEVDHVFEKALAKDPEQRYKSCIGFIGDLENACNKRPDWIPLARGAMETMPTVAGITAVPEPQHVVAEQASSAPEEAPPPPFVPATRRLSEDEEDAKDRNPIVKSVVWVLVGIGVVGLALLAAQHFLLRSSSPSVQARQEAPPSLTPSLPPAVKPNPGSGPPQASTSANAHSPAATQTPLEGPPPTPAPAAPQKSAAASAAGPKQVQFVTQPPGANVVIDDNPQLSCHAPCMLSLPAGRHTMRADADGYRTSRRIFYEPQDSDLMLTMDKAQGTLSISSTPSGAAISLNGQEQPQHTPAALTVPVGNYTVKISRNGAQAETSVVVHDGELRSISLQLQ